MKAGQGRDYGSIDENISVQDNVEVPSLANLSAAQRKTKMLIQVLAVALAPGDVRVLSGQTRKFQGPPTFPYIPAGDASGIVVALPPDNTEDNNLPFGVGDRVAVRFCDQNYGALGEYAIVDTRVTDKVPANITAVQAAALASASPALLLAEYVQAGDRVLVLGAGGGQGSHLVQILRQRGASLIVGSSKAPDRLLEAPLSCDKAIDYTKQDVFAMEEYQQNPFDIIIDFASGHWPRLVEDSRQGKPLIVKPAAAGGRYMTTSPDQPTYEIPTLWKMVEIFLFPALWRAAVSRTWSRSRLPAYSFGFALPTDRAVVTRTLAMAQEGKLQAVLHGSQTFAFTTEGVRQAFHVQESRHAQGKVVIEVAQS